MTKGTNNFKLETCAIQVSGTNSVNFGDNQLLSLKYTEDIKRASIHVELRLTDSQNGILSTLQGMERVTLSYSDHKGTTLVHELVIYDIQDRTSSGSKSKATLMCCSPEFIDNAAIKLSKRYGPGEGKQIHEIVKDDLLVKILGIDEKRIKFTETKNKFSFISPYWSPFTAIAWLCARAIPSGGSGKNASAGYCFFENYKGYNFLSYDSFAKATQVATFIVDMEEDELEEVKDKIPIDKMKVTSSADILKGLNIGSYSSTVMTLDMKDLKYTEYPFNINEYYKNVPKLNTDASLPAYYEGFKKGTAATRIMSKIVDTALFTAGTYSKDFTKQISQSALREKLFYNKMVEIDYIGEINLAVGDVVRLETFKGRDKELDTQNSGKYVIGRVERVFTSSRDSMSTKLTLFTDSPGVE